jgi:hypothetical protein
MAENKQLAMFLLREGARCEGLHGHPADVSGGRHLSDHLGRGRS